MTDWQPIATAPRDGTKIDLWLRVSASPRSFGWSDAFRVVDCWWHDGQWVHEYRGAPAPLYKDYVTHWMPLPTPPTSAILDAILEDR